MLVNFFDVFSFKCNISVLWMFDSFLMWLFQVKWIRIQLIRILVVMVWFLLLFVRVTRCPANSIGRWPTKLQITKWIQLEARHLANSIERRPAKSQIAQVNSMGSKVPSKIAHRQVNSIGSKASSKLEEPEDPAKFPSEFNWKQSVQWIGRIGSKAPSEIAKWNIIHLIPFWKFCKNLSGISFWKRPIMVRDRPELEDL